MRTTANRSISCRKTLTGYLFVLPATLVLFVFVIVPLIASLVSSFFDYTIMLDHFKFVGWNNYKAVLAEKRFWNSLKNTLYFTFVSVPISSTLSLAIALAISKNSRFHLLLRTAYFLPVVCSMTIVALSLSMMLDVSIGIIPSICRRIGLPAIDLLKDKHWAMPTIILISIYKGFGFNMVIFIAARQSVPQQYYEAAVVDGAKPWEQFRYITLPEILPTIAFAVMTAAISSFQVFDQVYVTTEGGPMFKTETAVQLIYQKAFAYYEFGPANANAFLLFIVIFVVTVLVRFYANRAEKN